MHGEVALIVTVSTLTFFHGTGSGRIVVSAGSGFGYAARFEFGVPKTNPRPVIGVFDFLSSAAFARLTGCGITLALPALMY